MLDLPPANTARSESCRTLTASRTPERIVFGCESRALVANTPLYYYMSDACSNTPLLGEDAPAKPSLLGTEALSSRQAHLDDRIRTLSLVICASAVLAAAVYYLQNILVRFVLALALQVLVHVAWSGLGLTLTLGGPKP